MLLSGTGKCTGKMSLSIWVPSRPPWRPARGHPSSSCPALWLTQCQEWLVPRVRYGRRGRCRGDHGGCSKLAGTCQQACLAARPWWPQQQGGPEPLSASPGSPASALLSPKSSRAQTLLRLGIISPLSPCPTSRSICSVELPDTVFHHGRRREPHS